jgi:excisionase family DNA binding protein
LHEVQIEPDSPPLWKQRYNCLTNYRTGVDPIAPSTLGFAKVAYAVGETLDLLSIGRTSLYAAVKRGDLKRVKFGKKTLFYAADLAAFMTRLRHLSESDERQVDHWPR